MGTTKSSINKLVWLLSVVALLAATFAAGQSQAPPCFFIFGDSLSDPGNNNVLATAAKFNYLPYGVDFPAGPTGRATNGRTVPDFLCNFCFSLHVYVLFWNLMVEMVMLQLDLWGCLWFHHLQIQLVQTFSKGSIMLLVLPESSLRPASKWSVLCTQSIYLYPSNRVLIWCVKGW